MGRTILIIDDNEAFRGMLRSLLAMRGYDVVAAANAAEGLRLASQGGIDGVLTDVDMPGIGGIEFCQELRAQAQPGVVPPPVWVMTGVLQPGITRRAAAAGALLVVRKPFNIDELSAQFEREFQHRPPAAPAAIPPILPTSGAPPKS